MSMALDPGFSHGVLNNYTLPLLSVTQNWNPELIFFFCEISAFWGKG